MKTSVRQLGVSAASLFGGGCKVSGARQRGGARAAVRAFAIPVLMLAGCASLPESAHRVSVDADRVLVIGASVSSGFSGTPAGEIVARWLKLPYSNEAYIASRLSSYVDALKIAPRTLIVDLDGSYWDSYARDCTAPVAAVKKLYGKAKGSLIVMATVPERRAGLFWEFFALAWSFSQPCREAINAAIVSGCGPNCVLIDADAFYSGREHEDIHLSPDAWRRVAEKIMTQLAVSYHTAATP